MIVESSSLDDVCFAVAAALEAHGIASVLTGGSAATLYAPEAYMSDDADFILDADDALSNVSVALATLGFERVGKSRLFTHPKSRFTIDFPKGPLAVGGEYIKETHMVQRGEVRLRILTPTDCVRDRLAHFYYWDDYTALNAAVAVTRNRNDVDFQQIRQWTERESSQLLLKFAEFERRVAQGRDQDKNPA